MSNTSSTPLPNTNQAYAEAPAVTNQSRPIRARSVWVGVVLPLAAAVLLAAAQPFWSAYLSDLVVKIMILSIFALSLHILVGGTGLVSLGHAAYFGLGAYAAVKAAGQDGSNFLVMLIAAVGVSGLYALIVGALSLRTKGVYFIMVTLAFAQLAFFVVHDVGYFGGSDGIYLMQRPAIGALDMESSTTQYYVVLAALVLVYAFIAMLGLMTAMTLLGWFPLGVLPAALAGALMAFLLWNFYPAKLRPGAVGCQFLAGALGCVPLSVGWPGLTLPLALPYWLEGGMVALQIIVWKASGGRRQLFGTAPLHRWLEKRGFDPVNIFYIFGVLAMLGLALTLQAARAS